MDKKIINYVVARPWDQKDPEHLAIYSYFHDVQRGTLEDAKNFLEYVKNKDNSEDYAIYIVNFRKIDEVSEM